MISRQLVSYSRVKRLVQTVGEIPKQVMKPGVDTVNIRSEYKLTVLQFLGH